MSGKRSLLQLMITSISGHTVVALYVYNTINTSDRKSCHERVSDLSRFSVQNNDIQNFTHLARNTVENLSMCLECKTLSTCDLVTRSHTTIESAHRDT